MVQRAHQHGSPGTGSTIKKEKQRLDTLLKEAIGAQLNVFVLNPNIQPIMADIIKLQENCPHVSDDGTTFDLDGICSICGKKK